MPKKLLIQRVGGQGCIFEAERHGDRLIIFDGCEIVECLNISEIVVSSKGNIFYKGTDLDGYNLTYLEI